MFPKSIRCSCSRRPPNAFLLSRLLCEVPFVLFLILTLGRSAVTQQFAIQTVAGNGQAQAPLNPSTSPGWISGIAADTSGNVFISVSDSNEVMKLDSQGNLTVIAGTGTAGYSGDGGLATSAELNTPVGIALDSQGNLYIADSGNQRVREVSASTGQINTVAGNGTLGQTGDGGPATSAELANPVYVALDSTGNLYIFDLGLSSLNIYDAVRVVLAELSRPFSTTSAKHQEILQWIRPEISILHISVLSSRSRTDSFLPSRETTS